MNKAQFIKALLEFSENENIPLYNIHVSHGGSLLMLGLKDETGDVDVTVLPEAYNLILSRLGAEAEKDISNNRKLLKVTDVIDIHTAEDDEAWKDLVQDESGILYRGIERTIYDYEQMGRPKDQVKIQLLQQKLNK